MGDFPAPDRSNVKPNFHKTAENDALDLGWAEGILDDGRPYRVECWAQDQLTMLTFFFSTKGIEDASQDALKQVLVDNKLVAFSGGQQYVEGGIWTDAQGHDLWSVNVVVGADDDLYVADSVELRSYERTGPQPETNQPKNPGKDVLSTCCGASIHIGSDRGRLLAEFEVDVIAGGGGPVSVWIETADGGKWNGTSDDPLRSTCYNCHSELGTTAGDLVKHLWGTP